MICGSASWSTLSKDLQYNCQWSIYGDSDADVPFLGF